MTIDRFVNQIILHEDYMVKYVAGTNIEYDMLEARMDALEAAMSAVYHGDTDADLSKAERMEDKDFIRAASKEFYGTYTSTLCELWKDTVLNGVTDNAKQLFISASFKRGYK